jgi:hypothetical protein
MEAPPLDRTQVHVGAASLHTASEDWEDLCVELASDERAPEPVSKVRAKSTQAKDERPLGCRQPERSHRRSMTGAQRAGSARYECRPASRRTIDSGRPLFGLIGGGP